MNDATREWNARVNTVIDRRFGSSAARLASSRRTLTPTTVKLSTNTGFGLSLPNNSVGSKIAIRM